MADRLILFAHEADRASFTVIAERLINMVYAVFDEAVDVPGRFVTTA